MGASARRMGDGSMGRDLPISPGGSQRTAEWLSLYILIASYLGDIAQS
jgi:hypothetical protein